MKKTVLYNITLYFIATMLILFGIVHFISPDFLTAFFPKMIPGGLQYILIYITGVLEVLLGAGLILQGYRSKAAIATMWMFIAYLPLHVLDLFKEVPVAGSPIGAVIRLFLQFLLIYMAWWLYKESKKARV